MTQDEFQGQIYRLQEAFGKNAYPTERTALIWRDVRHFDFRWLERTVDELLSSERQAPLPVAFSALAAMERERLYRIEKEKNSAQIEEFTSSFDAVDIKTICSGILGRVRGQISEPQYDAFKSGLADVANKTPPPCKLCDGSGRKVWYDEKNRVYVAKCSCRFLSHR